MAPFAYNFFPGIDVKNMNVKWLRNEIGLVSQQPILFDCSIEENIKYACPEATHEEVVDVARQANAHNFIESFPDGYATQVGQGSSLISGGKEGDDLLCFFSQLPKTIKAKSNESVLVRRWALTPTID